MSGRILIADDDKLVCTTIERILNMYQYDVEAVQSGAEVLEAIDESFDVIILDINMPGINGFQTLEFLNQKEFDIPVLFLTGGGSMDYAIKALNLGAYDFMTKPIDDLDIFHSKIKRALEKRMFVRQQKAYHDNLEKEVREKTAELAEKNQLLEQYSRDLENAFMQIMSSFQTVMEEKDEYTAGHSKRVTEYSLMIGKEIGIHTEDLLVLQRAAHIHDIGKLVVERTHICKPGRLTANEWEAIKKHPEVGANIIEPLKFLKRERRIIKNHHERLDGSGYPEGKASEQLDQLTRIIAIADSYDAMTSKRNYRPNFSKEQAIAELRRCSGTQFDEYLVETFARLIQPDN